MDINNKHRCSIGTAVFIMYYVSIWILQLFFNLVLLIFQTSNRHTIDSSCSFVGKIVNACQHPTKSRSFHSYIP